MTKSLLIRQGTIRNINSRANKKQSRALNWVRENEGRMIGTVAGFTAHLTKNMTSISHP